MNEIHAAGGWIAPESHDHDWQPDPSGIDGVERCNVCLVLRFVNIAQTSNERWTYERFFTDEQYAVWRSKENE